MISERVLNLLKDAVGKIDKESLSQVLESVKETGAAARTLLANEKVSEHLEKLGIAPMSRVHALEERIEKLEAELAELRSK